MDVEFVVPAGKTDLQICSPGQYYIEEPLSYKRIDEELRKAKITFKSEGPEYILEHFPVYYSIIIHPDKVNNDSCSKAIYDLGQALKQLSNNLDLILEDPDNIDPEVGRRTGNILKMLMYAYAMILVQLQESIMKKQKEILMIPTKKGRKNNRVELAEESVVNKMDSLRIIAVILEKQICRLWDPPVCEEAFINIIADVLFHFLQDPAIKNDVDLQSQIFHIFGYMLKNYNFSLTFRVRTVQIVKSKENEFLTSVIPKGIMVLVEQYSCKSLVRELVRELTEWQTDENAQDAPGTKHCSTILVEMTVLMPELMIPEVIYLIQYLNHESYTLRICILTIISEVILNVLCKEDMSEEEKESREFLLKQLDMHIWDSNAHVRAKVLQLWGKLQYDGAVPINMINGVFEKASRRVLDRAVGVRKSAIGLVTKFVETNPYSAILDSDEVKRNLESEQSKLEDLRKNACEGTLSKLKEREEKWKEIEDKVRDTVTEKLCGATQMQPQELMEMRSEDVAYIIRTYLEEGQYTEAFQICHMQEGKLEGVKETRKDMDPDAQIEFYVTLLHSVFSDYAKKTAAIINEGINGILDQDIQDEIEVLEKNIAYWSNVVKFLEIIEQTTITLLELLESAVMTDCTEAIDYFILAYRFKVKGVMKGLETMLELMGTGDKERKSAVADAYKRLFLTNEEQVNSKEFTEKLAQDLINVLKTVNLSSLPYFGMIVAEWVTQGLINNDLVSLLWKMFVGQVPGLAPEDCRASLKLLSFIGISKTSVIKKNITLVAEFAFKEKGLDDPDLVVIACEMLSQINSKPVEIENDRAQERVANSEPMWENLLKVVVEHYKTNNSGASFVIKAAVDLIYKLARIPEILCEELIRKLYPMIIINDDNADSTKLSCFIYLLGEVAIKQFTYLDTSVYKELKRRNYIRENRAKKKKADLNTTKANNKNMDESILEGAQADDLDSNFIFNVCETDIVDKNLLGFFNPLFEKILRNPDEFNNENLQTVTALTMMRFMILSDSFCRKNIRLMLTILERTKYTGVKVNILISMADLLNRFPNTIEPYSNYFYKCVRHECVDVRLTALSVTTNLLSQNMLRVKGIIAEIALCINDESEIIVNLVNKSFYGLSQQNPNPIYNVLPDIISHMSNDDNQIDEKTFRNVMTFLIKHIDKDKQMEPLVEKLITRITATINERHMRDVAYCLTIINHNEKSIEKLVELYPNYKLKLEDEKVLHLFISVVDKYKNSQKEEMKNAVRRLDDILRTGKTTEDGTNEAPTEKPKKKPARRGRATKKSKKAREDSDSD